MILLKQCSDGYPSCRGAEAGEGYCKSVCKASLKTVKINDKLNLMADHEQTKKAKK